MDDLAEKRVFADRAGALELVVAASAGLVVVAVSDSRVGEFGLARPCSPRDVAVGTAPGASPRIAVATDDDVLVAGAPVVDDLEPSGFGEAVAVAIHADAAVAGSPTGRVARYDGWDWHTVGKLSSALTSLAGDLVGTAEGMFRVVDDSLRPAGLSRVNDIALAAGTPLAATADGLYELGNGWLDALDGEFELVAGSPDGRAHAATADALFARMNEGWTPVDLPIAATVRAVAYGPRTYLVSAAGDLLFETDEGWERTALGLDGVTGAAVLGPA